ncbi:MAG: hypothetical protein MK082_04985 [Phycisphaerales bacterium]|nr:hypothetical protein [Phycisphaerales bacterium]
MRSCLLNVIYSDSNPGPEVGSRNLAASDELRRTIGMLVEERRRLRRQRVTNLILIGFAISIPFHLAIIIYLASVRMAAPQGAGPEEMVVEFAVLSESELEDLGEQDELEALDTPEVEELSTFSESLSEDLDTAAVAMAVSTDLSGAVPTPGGGAGLGQSDAVGGGLAGGASFFGVSSRGRRFAYIVDVSGSMNSNDKFPIAMAELKRSIKALPDYASFVVLLYSNILRAPPMQTDWFRANATSVSRVSRWIDTVETGGGTLPYPAFAEVFKLEERPDVIFFLTDGIIPEDTPEQVVDLNSQGRSVVVNTISFGQDASREPLQRMADESDGVYRHVDAGRRGQP